MRFKKDIKFHNEDDYMQKKNSKERKQNINSRSIFPVTEKYICDHRGKPTQLRVLARIVSIVTKEEEDGRDNSAQMCKPYTIFDRNLLDV